MRDRLEEKKKGSVTVRESFRVRFKGKKKGRHFVLVMINEMDLFQTQFFNIQHQHDCIRTGQSYVKELLDSEKTALVKDVIKINKRTLLDLWSPLDK